MKVNFKVSVFFFLVALNLNGQETADKNEIIETIIERNKEFMEFYNSGDAKGIAENIFSNDAQIYPPNTPVISGNKEVIEGFWQGVMNIGIAKADIRTNTATMHGNVIIESGDVNLFAADGSQIDEAKYIVIWIKQNGNWKIFKDIWNSKKQKTIN